jgi:uncharacterized protein (DUF433 family)
VQLVITKITILKLKLKEKIQALAIEPDKNTMTNELLQRITLDPEICHGKPCIRGLRYPVESILELLSSGMTHEELLADYEDLENEDILAVLLFAARLSQVKSVHRLAS